MATDYFDLHLTHAGRRSGEFETLCVCPVQESLGEGRYYHILIMNILKLI